MELQVLGACLKSRQTNDLVTEHLNDKDFSKEYQIIRGLIKEYYDRDREASRVDPQLLNGIIENSVQNKKHRERFIDMVEQAANIDVSSANMDELILKGKLTAIGMRLATALVNGDNSVDELYEEYGQIKGMESLDDLTGKGVEVLTIDDMQNVVAAASDGSSLLKVYPLSLNAKLNGGLGGGHHLVTFARPEMGKCLAVGTKVLMADGSVKNVEDIHDGELVAGPTGNRTVTGTTRGTAPMYRITYPWGDSYEVNDEHILSLKRSKNEGRHKHGDILNVPVKEYVTWPQGRKDRYKGWKAATDYPETAVRMPPYLLGLWIGDGSTGKPGITTVDAEVREAFEVRYGTPSRVEDGVTYYFGNTSMHGELVHAGVMYDKHLPFDYICGSREQRLELLAGIIDSDGHLLAGNKGYEIVTKKERLKDDYLKLARSLGFHATAKAMFKRATNSAHEGDWYWRIYVGAEAIGVVPVRLERKKGTRNSNPKRDGLQFAIKVEAIGEGEYAGFCVDGDHLFMLADFTVTHNTAFNLTIACGFASQGAPGIYFLNEDRLEDVYLRGLCCITGQPENVIKSDLSKWGEIARDMGFGNIMFVSLAPGTLADIDRFCEKYKPRWIVVDQLRNLQMKETNKVLQLEYATTGIRNIAKKHNLIAVSTTQAGDSAEGKRLLDMGDVDFSNTGVAAQADVLVGVGATREDAEQGVRYLAISKNKRGGGHSQIPVKISTPISRYMPYT